MSSSLKGAGLRYGDSDGVPQWAIGKTADEILDIASRAVTYIQSATPQQQPAPAPAPSSQNVQSGHAPDPELAYRDPTEWARQYAAYNDARMREQLQQVGVPVYNQLAAIARTQSKSGVHAEVWRRWEPEIELKLAGIPPHARTIELYDQAAALVKADHVDEIARERAEKLIGSGAGTERVAGSTSAYGNTAPDALEEAFASGHPFFEDAKRNGLSPSVVRRFLEQTGQTAEQYIKNATRGDVIVTKEGFSRAHG